MKRCKDCGAEIVSGRCCPACRKIRGDPQLMTYRKHGEEVRAYLETEMWPEYVYPDKVIKTNKSLFKDYKFTERGRRLILCRCLLELDYKKESIGFAHVFRKKD